jgi:excinuclease UvrABC nuclease subunit
MAEQSFSLNFKGYWLESHIDSVPIEPGIYCVFACTFNKQTKTVIITKLIYIGEADDVNQRIKNHEKLPSWRKALSFGEELCFSFAHLDSPNRTRAEASLIFKHKPPLNDDYKDSFPFDKTTILITGVSELLVPIFTVERSQ